MLLKAVCPCFFSGKYNGYKNNVRGLGGAAWILILFLSASMVLRAQAGSSTILGRVTDQTGAVVEGASVTLRNVSTNVTTVRKSNHDGDYTFSNLIPGTYTVMLQKQGFEQFEVSGIVLQVSQTAREDAALTIGQSVSTVQVTADLALVQTDTSSVGSVVDTKQIQSMPLNGRTNINSLLALAPGVQKSTSAAPRIGGATVLGSYNETIDGADATEPENEMLGNGMPSLDSIAEFKVVGNTGSAKEGPGAVAVVIVTKSGGNEFHGSLFEYNRVAATGAKDHFATSLPKPPFVRNEFGGSLGGPVKRDKLFFFGSFEGLTYRTSSTRQMAMPTTALLSGDFSNLPVITNPNTGLPFENNQIPAPSISSTSKAFFTYFDTPNLTSSAAGGLGTNWVGNVGTEQDVMRYEGRGDYSINQANRMFVRYYMSRYSPNVSAGSTDKWGTEIEPETMQNVSANYNHDFSPSLENVISFGYNRVWDSFASQNRDLDASTLVPGLTTPLANLGGLPVVNITGFSGFSDWTGSGDLEQTFQISDALTWTKGKHLVDAGFSWIHWDFYNFQNPSLGSFSFTGQYTGNAFADFLLGYLAGSSKSIAPLAATPTNVRYGFYVQDSWRLTNKLTFNYGLRYDLPTLYQNTTGNMANWYPDLNEIVTLKGTGNTDLFPGLPIVSGSSLQLGPSNYIGTNKTQFAPRIGFIYAPFGGDRLIARAGYGLYYQKIPWPYGSYEIAVNPPFTGTEFYEPAAGSTPTLTFDNAFPSSLGGISSGVTVNAYPRDYKYPMTGQWNVTVESQLSRNTAVRATYLGTESEHITQNYPINQPVQASGPIQPRRPYQPFGNINYYKNFATASTQQLQLSAIRSFSGGLSFQGQYQWTKMIDTGAEAWTNGTTDPLNVRLDRGNDESIRHQYFVGNYVYELPFGKGRRFASSSKAIDLIIGGWQTNGILTLGSGLPYSVTFTSAVEGWNSNYADRIGNPDVDHKSISKWFNPAAFALPAPFTFGNSGARRYFGPHYTNWDMAAAKNIMLQERYKLTFSADFFNAFNHANLSNPDANISDASVGQITSTTSSPRNIQFSLHLTF